ncbi:hypothetical protein LCGC14_0738540 [marine sediment metagenome]|uniref:Acylneuraminate cytidylyltransferase family protein n=2 Tax=root TaxID=1 RepID=A0A831QK76_9FLAO|nr:acylneuraminate cytidylyltransferase family protein [Pricia antarctica]
MITVFLPCRAGSERIPEKNTKDFSGQSGGLVKIKLAQLIKVAYVDSIVVSTNDRKVMEIANNFGHSKIKVIQRPEILSSSSTSTDDLIAYVPELIAKGHVLWTHVTSPFIDDKVYNKAVSDYLNVLKDKIYDSLMTVNKMQTFLWDKEGSFNYDRNVEKWPRTQTLPEIFEINSGIFINSIDNYKKYKDRIGKKPLLLKTEGYHSFDIDWPEDFIIAEQLYKAIQ